MSDELREKLWESIQTIRSHHNNVPELTKLIDYWELEYGPEYDELAEEVVAEKILNQWATIAADRKTCTADDLVKIMWEDWDEGEFSITKKEDGFQIYCTKCPIADNYREIGREDYGLIFQCSEDPHIVAGFNPKMKFRRTKTLMAGDDCCDHFYGFGDP